MMYRRLWFIITFEKEFLKPESNAARVKSQPNLRPLNTQKKKCIQICGLNILSVTGVFVLKML